MNRSRLLAALLALAPCVVSAAPAELKDLSARWNQGDPQAGHELAALLTRPGAHAPFEVLDAMRLEVPDPPYGGPGPEVHTGEFPYHAGFDQAVEAVVAAVKPYRDDPDRYTRDRAEAVMKGITDWKNLWSDGARATRRGFQLRRKLEDWGETAIVFGMPLTVVVFTLLTLFWRVGALSLLFGATTAYRKAFGDAALLLRRERLVALLPAASALVIGGILAALVLSIFANPPPPGTKNDDAEALALIAVLSPRVLVAYFTGGFLLYFLQATFLHALMASARGRAVSLGGSLLAALRRAGDVLLLSVMVFGVLLFLEVALRKHRDSLPRVFVLPLRIAVWLLQNGVQLGASLILAACMDEGVSLAQGFERARGVVSRDAAPAAAAWLGAATIGGEMVVGAFAVSMICGFMAILAAGYMSPNGDLPTALGLWWVSSVHLVAGGAFLCGALGAGVGYALYMVMEALIATGLLLHLDAAPLESEPPLVAYLREKFPSMAAHAALPRPRPKR
ncbi:MAG: hypothetical protein SF051_15320 [Elusimicrobiota bacterium]|nr:hypothetical protein [Elusimicrobiota bacterium]